MKNRYDFLAREFTQKSQPIKIIITWKFEILDLTYRVHISQHSHEFENHQNATSVVAHGIRCVGTPDGVVRGNWFYPTTGSSVAANH